MAFTITKFEEWCPNCESENEFRSDGHKVYICQHCGYALAPCSLCEMDKARCSECEISESRAFKENALLGNILKAIEVSETEERLKAIENALSLNNDNNSYEDE